MIARIENYTGDYRIVSLAKNEKVKEDLLQDQLDFLYVSGEIITLYPDDIILSKDKKIAEKLNMECNYNVYELYEDGRLIECYDDASLDNFFFVTGKCNSNCLMCPSPIASRKNEDNVGVKQLIEIAKHIPDDTKHLTITGGEPFMCGMELFEFIEFLKNKFERTEFLFLTNGRVFALPAYVSKFVETLPNNSLVAIPLHGSNARIHDEITQTRDSFEQTFLGIKELLKNKIRVELRIVVSRLNAEDIENIATLIAEEFSTVEYISIIAMEMTGSARDHSEQVWLPYHIAAEKVLDAVHILISKGINVKLYNFPLCTVDRKLWSLCEKSISPQKVRYSDECSTCKMLDSCGGVFAGTLSMVRDELKRIV